MGCQWPSISCCKTAPTATSEASVIIDVGAPGMGWIKSEASARVSLIWLKAAAASSVQTRGADLFLL